MDTPKVKKIYYAGHYRSAFPRKCLNCGSEYWACDYAKKLYCSRNCCTEYKRRLSLEDFRKNGRKCPRCKSNKCWEDFGESKSRWDGKQLYCLSCNREFCKEWHIDNRDRRLPIVAARNKKNREAYRKFILNYLLGHPCVDCGEKDPIVLDFDHVRGTKKHNIARMGTCTLDKIIEEISKCDIRCANCHRRKTAREGRWMSRILEKAVA